MSLHVIRASRSHRRRVLGSFAATDIPRAQSDALMWLYNATDGPNWTDNTGWGSDPTANNWYGVTVSGGHVTALDLNSNGLDGDIGLWSVDELASLETLSLRSTSVSGDISGWTLPSSLVYLSLHSTSVSGDVSGWTLPSSLVYLYLYSTSVSGDVSGWTLPASLVNLLLYSTSVSGDISGWTLPSSLVYLYLYSTSVSGDVSGWTLPSSLVYLSLRSTSVSGDISGWTLPASLETLSLHSTSVSRAPVMTSAIALADYRYYNCGLSQADVDAVLLSIYNRRTSFTDATPSLQIGGTNAIPGGTYQDGDPPTTGLEYVYELCNDPEVEGFNTWTITYKANGGDTTKP